jgi:ATP-grasp domain
VPSPSMGEGWEGVIVPVAIHSGAGRRVPIPALPHRGGGSRCGKCDGSTGSGHRRVGAGDGRRRCRSYHWRVLRPTIGPGARVRQWRRDGRGLQRCGPATLPHHALGSTGDDRRGQRARLLQGFRGRPAADLEALADTLVRVSYLAMHLEGHLAELDINPLMVLPSGQAVKAVDAPVVLRGT